MRMPRLVRFLSGAVMAALAGVSVCSAAQEEQPLWNGREMLSRASVHNPDSCLVMGLCYFYGLGIGQDIQKAEEWFTLGAEGGNVYCMRELAKLYRFGQLVPKDLPKAIRYMRQATKAGSTPGMLMLGWTYLTGQGVEKDFVRAYKLFLLAARSGDAEAFYWLGVFYQRGIGVPVDEAQALQWYGIGAWRGSTNCMVGLGNAFARGQGAPRDLQQSRFWLHRAAGEGVAEAQAMLHELELAESVAPVPAEQLELLTAQQCWEQYLHAATVSGNAFSAQTQAWLERAVELGHPRAAAQLASERFSVLASPQENARYLPALEKAAAAGEPAAWAMLANYYNLCLNGEEDLQKIKDCVRCYVESSQCAGAMMSMADGYALGFYSEAPDIQQMVGWTRQSASKGFHIAKELLPFLEQLARSAGQAEKN